MNIYTTSHGDVLVIAVKSQLVVILPVHAEPDGASVPTADGRYALADFDETCPRERTARWRLSHDSVSEPAIDALRTYYSTGTVTQPMVDVATSGDDDIAISARLSRIIHGW